MPERTDSSLGFALLKTAARLRLELAQRLRPFDLTTEQYAVLVQLWEGEGVSQSTLAELLLKDKPNITRIIAKVERKGLVQRDRDPDDRRSYQVHLTPAGRELQDVVMPVVYELREQAYHGLDKTRQNELRRLLDTIFRNLN